MNYFTGIASLSEISTNACLRCDVKQFDSNAKLIQSIRNKPYKCLGDFFPTPLVKGAQPNYLVGAEEGSVPVISTICIQKQHIVENEYKYISSEDYSALSDEKKLKQGDVLLTLDGGTSIGKPALYNKTIPCTVDSHVAIIRPCRIKPQHLVILLASPICQLQFRLYESGASGQTSVTEDDLRRFIVPVALLNELEILADNITRELDRIKNERIKLDEDEINAWNVFSKYKIE